jgi:PAS domain S-box-containing protein
MSNFQTEIKFDFGLFDNFPDMYFIVDSNGKILKTNKLAKEHLANELKKEENFFDMIELCDRNEADKVFADVKLNSVSKFINTRLFINRNYLDVNITFIPFLNGQTEQYIIAVRNISEEKQKEIELTRFFNIAENSVNPIQITDLNGRMIYVNRAFEIASGYSKDELLGKNPRVFGSGKLPTSFWDKMWATISSGKVWVGEVENRKKNGEPFYTQLLISPIIDKENNVTGYFAIHRDLSEKRSFERQLIHSQKMESIGTLAAGIAHEVGNPLASISALVQVAQRSTKEPLVIEKLGLVKNQITRISKIIRDLVDFSRPSNYELKFTDINKVLIEAIEITKVGTKAKDITFESDLSSMLPNLPLIADQIQQVFLNILLNAVDAISEKKNKFNEKIKIKSFAEDDYVVIIFTDTGPGISEENLNKIFEPFFTTKKEGKGTGLGLWVSYGIVKSFQGEIKVSSKIGQGTTFTIKLPINNQ